MWTDSARNETTTAYWSYTGVSGHGATVGRVGSGSGPQPRPPLTSKHKQCRKGKEDRHSARGPTLDTLRAPCRSTTVSKGRSTDRLGAYVVCGPRTQRRTETSFFDVGDVRNPPRSSRNTFENPGDSDEGVRGVSRDLHPTLPLSPLLSLRHPTPGPRTRPPPSTRPLLLDTPKIRES